MKPNINVIISIAMGAVIGTLLRYSVDLSFFDIYFPVNTILVNLIGSLVLGMITAYFTFKKPSEWLTAGLGIGVCGGFTTMSTLANDATMLIMNEDYFLFLCYILVSVIGGIGLTSLGYQRVWRWQSNQERSE
ncbi:fluoride efflux transporter FluC [Alkalibacillus aidingensis]|uniref:fluoride efflux transporter FluC n=1 Tax=Alkalibacillus aidingensis TaxID=2747607 RepID=UPI001660F68F|nr:CrcB family protein [Alkalibacillus aidingensis]